MLDSYKSGGQGDPFMYDEELGFIATSTGRTEMLGLVVEQLEARDPQDRGHFVASLQGKKYLVTYTKSERVGRYLIDYLPLEQILSPITQSRNLFYVSIGLLIVMGLTASYLLYRHIQVPIRYLVRGVRQIQRGELSARIPSLPNNEFDFLFVRFNEMAARIQLLIENVYQEKLRSREATLKQLQSQINPHFLYNALFFVKNMAKLGETDAVVAMTDNLGDYYRYATRVENQLPLLHDEIELVRNYLVIQNLRMNRIRYEIDVPERMLDRHVPRLIVQPIVENAIIHGLEPKADPGSIRIVGRESREACELIVEDDGIGMTEEECRALIEMLDQKMGEEMGCGVWNVHQRLGLQFGEGSGLEIVRLQEGTRVTLRWKKNDEGS
jgi:two-component system sensor histidine kinase YesM